jgi:hypothetical protein
VAKDVLLVLADLGREPGGRGVRLFVTIVQIDDAARTFVHLILNKFKDVSLVSPRRNQNISH